MFLGSWKSPGNFSEQKSGNPGTCMVMVTSWTNTGRKIRSYKETVCFSTCTISPKRIPCRRSHTNHHCSDCLWSYSALTTHIAMLGQTVKGQGHSRQ